MYISHYKMEEKKVVALLKKYAPDEVAFNVILKHSKKVQEIALRLAKDIPEIDLDLIKTGALLHDIGRFNYWAKKPRSGKEKIRHGIAGAEILRKEGFGKYARIAETHIGAGITKQDIEKQGLDLPLKDYVPKTGEEKIIAHADNLAEGSREIKFEKAVERFKKELGGEYAERMVKLKKEVGLLKNGGHTKAEKRAN